MASAVTVAIAIAGSRLVGLPEPVLVTAAIVIGFIASLVATDRNRGHGGSHLREAHVPPTPITAVARHRVTTVHSHRDAA